MCYGRLCRRLILRLQRRGSKISRQSGSVLCLLCPRAGFVSFVADGWAGGRTWSFIRFLRAPVPTLIILLANSTPIVWEERTFHSFFTNRWRRHDLLAVSDTSSSADGLKTVTYFPVPLGPSKMIFAR
jgi:hypothetical protein